MFLLSSGVGRLTMHRSAAFGLAIGFFVGGCYYISASGDADVPVFEDESTNAAFNWVWEGALLLLDAVVWLAPRFLQRRPAAIYWSKFWAVFRVSLMSAEALCLLDFDWAFCAYHAVVFLGFGVLKVWVAYKTFVVETRW